MPKLDAQTIATALQGATVHVVKAAVWENQESAKKIKSYHSYCYKNPDLKDA